MHKNLKNPGERSTLQFYHYTEFKIGSRKSKYDIDWKLYNTTLINIGDLRICISEETIKSWLPPKKRGKKESTFT